MATDARQCTGHVILVAIARYVGVRGLPRGAQVADERLPVAAVLRHVACAPHVVGLRGSAARRKCGAEVHLWIGKKALEVVQEV